ncbi:MAG: Gfo/Idh/MocA family oxidoreductase [Anaerolineae bacterium]|nr:Gfo/Idh/MocA family oxidoreductase [Anaerolineae bacterium]
MSEKVRFGVIGCGVAAWMGHLPWIWSHPQAELVAACDTDMARARQAQERYNATIATTDHHELLTREDIDAVCICTPPGSHAPLTIEAFEHKKHVLLEKPMGRSLDECRTMIVAARRSGRFLMMGHEKRFNLAFERVRQIIEQGTIGEVFYLVVHWGASVKLAPERMIPAGYRENYEWRWKDPNVGGGILQDHLPHYVDLWRWWTGAEVESVYAEVQNITRDYLNRPDIGLWEDFGTVMMRFGNGAVGVFNTGTVGRGLSPILHIGSQVGEWSEFGYIFGTRGQITFDMPPWDSPENGRIMVWSLDEAAGRGWYQVEMPDPRRSPGGPLSPATNENYMFYRQIDHFVRAIQSGTPPGVGGGDGVATLAVVDAVYESQRGGQRVLVQPPTI